MKRDSGEICVYYDGACDKCIQDRDTYQKLAGNKADNVCWIDITGQEEKLRAMGIDPEKALSELHVKDENGRIVSELDAYILLMQRVNLLRPIAWLIGLPLIRSLVAKIYHFQVNSRLRRDGRL